MATRGRPPGVGTQIWAASRERQQGGGGVYFGEQTGPGLASRGYLDKEVTLASCKGWLGSRWPGAGGCDSPAASLEQPCRHHFERPAMSKPYSTGSLGNQGQIQGQRGAGGQGGYGGISTSATPPAGFTEVHTYPGGQSSGPETRPWPKARGQPPATASAAVARAVEPGPGFRPGPGQRPASRRQQHRRWRWRRRRRRLQPHEQSQTRYPVRGDGHVHARATTSHQSSARQLPHRPSIPPVRRCDRPAWTGRSYEDMLASVGGSIVMSSTNQASPVHRSTTAR